MTSWRAVFVLFGITGLLHLTACSGDQAPCGMAYCNSDEVCCVSPPSEPVCVKGSSCPASQTQTQ
jgi:hypothetical protein